METLKKFKVGAGLEKFRNEDGPLSHFESVYFPLFRPRSAKNYQKAQQRVEEINKSGCVVSTHEKKEIEGDSVINTETA